MKTKITLITPPDIFENSNPSILFAHLSEDDQDTVSKWLAQSDFSDKLNLYVYNGEPNVSWLLYAASRCEYKYIDLNGINYITQALSGYVLGKEGFYYKTSDDNLSAIYSHISQNRVEKVEQFLEIVLGDKTT